MKRSFFLAATAAVAVAPALSKQVVTVMKPQADFGFQNLTFNGTPVYVDNTVFISRPWSWKDCSNSSRFGFRTRMPKKGTGLSREPRIRAKQEATLEAYAEQAPLIGGDPAADRAAKILAVERGGYTRAQTNEAKLKQFERLWKSDESRQYLAELWGAAIPEHQDPVSIAFQTIHQHMVQDDPTWGDRERGVSLAASRQVIAMFVPNQTTKIASMSLSAKIERPAQYDQEPVMESRSILPAGQTIAKPTGPTGEADDEDEDDDE